MGTQVLNKTFLKAKKKFRILIRMTFMFEIIMNDFHCILWIKNNSQELITGQLQLQGHLQTCLHRTQT